MGKSTTHLIFVIFASVLFAAQCAEKSTEVDEEDRRVISALVEAVHLNQHLQDTPDSLEQLRRTLLERHGLTEADLNQWLENNRNNLALWGEVEARIQQGIEQKKKEEKEPLKP